MEVVNPISIYVLLNMQLFDTSKNSINQSIGVIEGHSIYIKREDMLHPIVSGNKFRKLNFIFQEIVAQQIYVALTFGGAFSNHLAATACAGKLMGIKTFGIVRGEEWQNKISESNTLSYCASMGMQLYCISRSAYAEKEAAEEVQTILKQQSNYRLIPEGGTEALTVKGCTEILNPKDSSFDVICSSVGTGGTLAGLVQGASEQQTVIGFNALKNPEVNIFVSNQTQQRNWEINADYTFGGYAKITPALIDFMNTFYEQYQIPLDPVYTGKMLFAIFDLIKKKQWRWGKHILAIHTGGLQGVSGMNRQLQKKKLPVLNYQKFLP